MASYKDLDDILTALKDSTDNEPLDLEEHIKSNYKKISSRDREAMIRKLLKDEMIDFVKPNTNKEDFSSKYIADKPYYFISFEGIILLESGGYIEVINQKDKKEKVEKFYRRMTILILLASSIGSLFSAFYYLVELVNKK